MSLPALITPLLVNAFFSILAIFLITFQEYLPFFLASFLIVSLIPYISNPDSLGDLTVFIIFSISSFEINNTVVPDP